MKLKAIVQPEQVGGFSISIPALPGCVSEGETVDEALHNICEAAELWLQSALQDLEVEVSADLEDAELTRQAREIKLPQEKLVGLCRTHRPPASWFEENLDSSKK